MTQTIPIAYAYVTSAGSSPGSAGAVYQYAILTDGSLSPLAPALVGAGMNPSAVVVVGGYVYVVNAGDGTISQYNIESDNTLTPMNPATVNNPGMNILNAPAVGAAAVDSSESFLYVANTSDGTVSEFSIGADGQLTSLAPATVAAGVEPISIVTTPSAVYVLNSGAPGETGSVSQYSEASNGALVATTGTSVAAGTNPTVMTFNAAGSDAYVLSNCDGAQCLGSIRLLSVGAGGALTDTGTIATTGSHYRAVGMAIDETGANGYVLSNELGVDTANGALWHFQVASTGVLTAADPSPVEMDGVAQAQSLTGNSLYVLRTNTPVAASAAVPGGSIMTYTLDSAGTPTLQATNVLETPNPSSIVVRRALAP